MGYPRKKHSLAYALGASKLVTEFLPLPYCCLTSTSSLDASKAQEQRIHYGTPDTAVL